MSVSVGEIRAAVRGYLERHPEEAEPLRPLIDALRRGTDLASRYEFDGGHVTCGAVVVDGRGRVLLVRHRALGAWLLPGGHLEPHDDGLLAAARRELAEETGLSAAAPVGGGLPVDIDVHAIPADPDRGEPAHWHADFRFAFRAGHAAVTVSAAEVDGYAWRPGADTATARLAVKIAAFQ